MSYILDALNKSEQERQQREHGVSLQPLTGVPHAGKSGPRWLPLAAIAIVITVIGIFAGVYFMMKSQAPAAPSPQTAPVAAPPPIAKPAPVAAAPKPSVAASAPSAAATFTVNANNGDSPAAAAVSEKPVRAAVASDSVKSLYQRKGMSTEQAMAQAAAEETPAASKAGATGSDAAVKTFAPDATATVQTQEVARQNAEAAIPKSTVNQKALDAEIARQREAELAARVQAELDRMQALDAKEAAEKAKLAKSQTQSQVPAAPKPKPKAVEAAPDPDANVPMATQLSADVQKRIPNIDFGAHVYAGRTNNGFVILNGKKRYNGDTVAPGLVVERITEDGVILDMSGTRFRLNSMSSWIN